MPFLLKTTITNFLKLRDELSLRNIRKEILPLILIFPLSVIVGDLRYFDLKIEMWGLQSFELMLYPLGLGWLVLAFIPQKMILPLLRTAAVCSALLLPFQFILTEDLGRLAVFMAFQFINGICAASAFFLFCFRLNNVERLFGMSLIIFYYGFWYTIWRTFPIVQDIGKTWGGALAVAVYVAVVFLCHQKEHIDSTEDGKGAGAGFVITLHMVYYTIMCTINYLEWMEHSVASMPFGIGQFAAILFILLIQVRINQSALYIWLMYLVLSLLGLGILIYNSQITSILGSLIYGLGDGVGYIIIYYLCAGAIKKSKSLKMYRFACLVLFIEYCLISGVYSQILNFYDGSNHYLAFGVVLVLCSVCLLFIPVMQKRLYNADWTDGIHLQEIPEYAQPLAETETFNARDDLGLTGREQDILAMLLKGISPKEIGYTLKVSYHTVGFHRKNLYRKLGIQSIHELITKYGSEVS
ncbi:MAG: helix-turn-helix transcriptional regulator [Treponema sp.]|nr:helix-turn-helix transcriptional regulator [Treponema sp.]